MLLTGVAFSQVILAVHILAVVATFGVTFAYPLMALVARSDPRTAPGVHRLRMLIGQRLINPGLLVVLLAGIYLASDLHQWKKFYVQWGFAAVVVLGALEGGVMIRGERKLARLADRELGGSSPGGVTWSAEYSALRKRTAAVGGVMSLLVVVTVYLMTVGAP
ncbi:MAG: hypothetical protein ACR2LV_04595 [Solirubrobacteraceae bacterium]